MRNTRITAAVTLVAGAATALGLAAPAAQADAAPRTGTTSLAEVLAADGHGFDHHWADFDVLDAVVGAVLKTKPDSPVAVLADGDTRLTAFLPTDRAFRKLDGALTGTWPHTEKGVFRSLAGAVDVDTLETVLLYHVVPGATLTSAKVLQSDGATLTTAQGATVTVQVRGRQVRLEDQDPNARDARANPRQLDVNAGNRQIAHGIDRVLRPADL